MKKNLILKVLQPRYGLQIEFVQELYDKIVDKDNFGRAVRMLAAGTMPYDIATGKDPNQRCR
jgi:hypothetical protein